MSRRFDILQQDWAAYDKICNLMKVKRFESRSDRDSKLRKPSLHITRSDVAGGAIPLEGISRWSYLDYYDTLTNEPWGNDL